MNTEPQIEPVTDDDLRAAQNIGERPGQIRLVAILEQDRRRVAERQAARTAEMAAWVGIAAEIERLRGRDAYWPKLGDLLKAGCDDAPLLFGMMRYEVESNVRLRAEVAKLRAQMDADLATYTETMEEATATMARAEAELVASSAEVARLTAALNGKENSDA